MGTDNQNYYRYKYSPILLSRYIRTLSLNRRVLSKFFEKYKISKEEYDNWFDKEVMKN